MTFLPDALSKDHSSVGQTGQYYISRIYYYYYYSALLQMVRLILRERTLDCACKRRHAQKYASVLSDIKHVNYMLYWVVSIFENQLRECRRKRLFAISCISSLYNIKV